MPSNFRRFAPMFILLVMIWSFMINFTFGLLVSSSIFALGAFVYQSSLKKWEELVEDDLLDLDFGNFEDEMGPNLPSLTTVE